MKNGKLPASSRALIDDLTLFAEQSAFDVDPAIKKDLEAKGKTLRWINATEFTKSGGFNGKGWSPVRVADIESKVLAGSSMGYGSTAEGFIIRKDMMLAQRPKETTDKHERLLSARARLASGKSKQNADQIRDGLGKYGNVIEGYEENGDE